MVSDGFDGDSGLGLGDVNELAKAAGGLTSRADGDGASAEGAHSGDVAPQEVALPPHASEHPKPKAKPIARPDAPGTTAPLSAREQRKLDIRKRLEEIGDPFARRQALGEERSKIVLKRAHRDEELRKEQGRIETLLAEEQHRAQWVADEKHKLEAELAKLEKAPAE
jgi:hypothetical protein